MPTFATTPALGGCCCGGCSPLLLGAAWCVKHWRQPVAQLLLLGLLAAAVPAALTQEGTPHALRSASMVPFLFAIAAIGWQRLARLSVARQAVVGGLVGLLVVQAAIWTTDLYRSYPDRARAWFGDGQPDAVAFAEEVRGQGRMLLSFGVSDFVYWYALFSLRPDPRVGLWAMGVQVASAQDIAALSRPGDVAVLGPREAPPPGARLLAERPGAGVWFVESPP
jgi:hypothetical protein